MPIFNSRNDCGDMAGISALLAEKNQRAIAEQAAKKEEENGNHEAARQIRELEQIRRECRKPQY